MKKIALNIFLCLFFFAAKAQQLPQYTQYLQNMQVINPALSGIYQAVQAKTAIRNQWTGIENAPRTAYVSLSMPVNFDPYYLVSRSTDFGISDPENQIEADQYHSSEKHHGIGMMILHDEAGGFKRSSALFTYAYHLKLGDMANLSVGVGAGIKRNAVELGGLNFADPDEPILSEGDMINWAPDLQLGVYFYSGKGFAGASIHQILPSKLAYGTAGQVNERNYKHYFLTAGLREWLGDDISLTPSVMLRYVRPFPLGTDLNLKVAYRNDVWLAGSFRRADSFSPMFGFGLGESLEVGYAYDFNLSPIGSAVGGSHELTLGLKW